MKLFYIFPLKGPINGVKIIATHVLDRLKRDNIDIVEIDTSQAVEYSNFGKFSLKKVFFLKDIFSRLKSLDKNDYVLMNLSTKGFSFYRDLAILSFLIYKDANITIQIHANGLEDIKSGIIKNILNRIKIIVINKKQYQDLHQYKNVFYLENSLPDYYNGIFDPIVASKNTIQLLYMSNLSRPKGIDLLNEICEVIASEKLNYTITICGGILDEYTKSILSRITSKYGFLNYIGPIDRIEAKMEIYQKHDFLLFLSNRNYEVYPLVYIEALMNGLSVITTEQIVADGIISDGRGLLLKNDNFITFISEFSGEKLRNLKKSNRQKFEDDYQFESYFQAIKKIIFNEL